jgi:uncharacterized RDD family membrane protein YckC
MIEALPPRARQLQGSRAGLVSRFIAASIDLGVVVLALLAIYLGIAAVRFLISPRRFSFPEVEPGVTSAIGWSLLVLYLAVGWASTGRTVGAQMMGLRVVNRAGQRMRFIGAFGRALVCALFPIGLFWCAISRSNRSVADILLRTSVIYDWRVGIPPKEPGPEGTVGVAP